MAKGLARHVMPLLKSGGSRRASTATFPVAEAAASHALLESGKVFGKLVLVP